MKPGEDPGKPLLRRSHGDDVPGELRTIARAVRAIGSGRGADPESTLIEKHEAAERLFRLAARMEARA